MSIPIPKVKYLDKKLKETVEIFVQHTLAKAPLSKLLPIEAEEARRKHQLFELLRNNNIDEKIQFGIEQIVHYIEEHEEEDCTLVVQDLAKIGQLVQVYKKGEQLPQTLQETLGLTDTCLEMIYQMANRLFEEKAFSQASAILFVLASLNPFVYAFWLTLALAKVQSKKYQEALVPLAVASLLDPDQPAPRIYACECYLAFGDFTNGEKELTQAETITERLNLHEWSSQLQDLKHCIKHQGVR